jgi:hypothetical protein
MINIYAYQRSNFIHYTPHREAVVIEKGEIDGYTFTFDTIGEAKKFLSNIRSNTKIHRVDYLPKGEGHDHQQV